MKWTVAQSLEDMDQGEVATSILSISEPSVFFGNFDTARKLARETNEFGAKLIADHPGRFGMFATVPLPDVDGSLREIEYALDTLKMDGICMMTDYQGKFLGDPAFRTVLEELNRRKAVVYTHPFRNDCCRNLVPDVFEPLIELGTDTTRTIASLLFSGSAEQFPDIRWTSFEAWAKARLGESTTPTTTAPERLAPDSSGPSHGSGTSPIKRMKPAPARASVEAASPAASGVGGRTTVTGPTSGSKGRRLLGSNPAAMSITTG